MKKIIMIAVLSSFLVPNLIYAAPHPMIAAVLELKASGQTLTRDNIMAVLLPFLNKKPTAESYDSQPDYVKKLEERFADRFQRLEKEINEAQEDMEDDEKRKKFAGTPEVEEFYLEKVKHVIDGFNDDIFLLVTRTNKDFKLLVEYNDKYDIDFNDHELKYPKMRYQNADNDKVFYDCEVDRDEVYCELDR